MTIPHALLVDSSVGTCLSTQLLLYRARSLCLAGAADAEADVGAEAAAEFECVAQAGECIVTGAEAVAGAEG